MRWVLAAMLLFTVPALAISPTQRLVLFNKSFAQSRPTNIYDLVALGADPTGNTDASSALNSAFSNGCSQSADARFVAPPSAIFAVASTVVIANCHGATLSFQTGAGNETNLTGALKWIGPSGGTVLSISNTNDSIFDGLNIIMGTANIGLDVDENPTDHNTTTHNVFENILVKNISVNSSLVAVRLGASAPGNVERQVFKNLSIVCSDTQPVSSTSNGIGFLAAAGTHAEPYYTGVYNVETANCSEAFKADYTVQLLDIEGGLMSYNYTILDVLGGEGHILSDIRDEGSVAAVVIEGQSKTTIRNFMFDGIPSGATVISFPGAPNAVLKVEDSDFLSVDSTITPVQALANNGADVILENNTFNKCIDPTAFQARMVFLGNRATLSTPVQCPDYVSGPFAVSAGYTIATLPASPTKGARAFVTDQTNACPSAGGALAGGGSVTCPVFYNGAGWVGD